MERAEPRLQYFLGAVTPDGFLSRFDQLADPTDGWRCLVIKGGPGCGKSTLLGKLAQAFGDRWGDLEYIHCSSDVESLDALRFPSIRVAVADGTLPHPIEPHYPGAFESLVDMTGCWNEEVLYHNREVIYRLYNQCDQLREQCSRSLFAAATLLGDNRRIAAEATDHAKVLAFARRFCDRELKPRHTQGKEQVRFLSAMTDQGTVFFEQTAALLADRIWRLEDDWGYSSRLLLEEIRREALARGYQVISCPCPLFPEDPPEHLFLPELSLGFLTVNRFHGSELLPERVINSRRFTDQAKLRRSKQRLSFCRRTATQMLRQAAVLQAENKVVHDRLETCYKEAMDYDETTSIAARLIDRINTIADQQEAFRLSGQTEEQS